MHAESTPADRLPAIKEKEMKLSKILGVAAVAAMALMAFANSASATTLYTNNIKRSESVTIHATHTSADGTLLLSATGGGFANTCTESTLKAHTTVFTGGQVSGPIDVLTFGGCTEPVTVDKTGTLSIEQIGETANGTLRSSNAEVTTGSPFGTLNCKTSNTDVGTLTGTTSGTTVVHVNAVLNCGFFLPSAIWEGTYTITGHSIHVTA
jgi:hypothetical protein